MKQTEIRKLRRGDFIMHMVYGLCIVDDYLFHTGLIICPLTSRGMHLLALHSGKFFNRLLENSQKALLYKVENPVIPLLIVKENGLFKVQKWYELGRVTETGDISANIVRTFDTLKQAQDYVKFHEKRLAQCAI